VRQGCSSSRSTARIDGRAGPTASPIRWTLIRLLGLRCPVLPRSSRSYATAGSRRSGRFGWLSSQRGTVSAGALNPDSVNHAVALQPLHQGAITHRRCGKLTIAELAPEVIDHSGMVAVAMGVHAAGDTDRRPCHAGHALPLPFAAVRWAHAAVGIGGQASDGRLLRRLL
jgi:hypothetical protein